jgi:hypothetical protein
MKEQKIIKKVLEELGKEKPDISYIRGLLEGLVDEDDKYIIANSEGKPIVRSFQQDLKEVEEINKKDANFEDMGKDLMKKVNFNSLQ